MSLPQPKIALNNACSVIFNNTLYTYSADAFQSLRLEQGAKWKELHQGEKVTGGVCVGSTTGNPSTSAFFVVGGVGETAGYLGLQKYTYSTGQWENITLRDPKTHQRTGHNAVYINSTDSILLFGGTQEGSQNPTAETFTIGASAPHSVASCESSAPKSTNPILLPWSPGEIVLVGGSTWNAQVMLFSAEQRKWVDSGATLASPLPKDTSAIQAVLVTGDDGSKNLITFDMSESPNTVRRTVLYNRPGEPVQNAAPVRRRTSKREEQGHDSEEEGAAGPLTLNNWPTYNSTLVPKVTRTNYALAQGPDGMVVIAGGHDKDVLRMFDARRNSWQDPSSVLSNIKLLSVESSSTSTASPTSTSASASATSAAVATSTDAPAPAVSGDSGPPLSTILGAVLGGVFGLAALLALIYLCILRRRKRQAHMEAGHVRRASGMSPTDKEGFGFAKETFALGQGPAGVFRGHQQQDSQSSISSMAILMGRTGQNKSAPSGLGRTSSNESGRDSPDSTFRAFKSTIGKPMPQPAQPPATARSPQSRQQTGDEKGPGSAAPTVETRPRNLTTGADRRGSTRRSSGWNRYWSGGSALNLLGFGSGNNNSAANISRRTTQGSDRSSDYGNPHHMTQDSTTVPPLTRTFEPRLSLSRVAARSPTIAVYNEKLLTEGMSGQIEMQRPISAYTDVSASAYSSGVPESVQEAWDPTAANKPWGAGRSINGSSTGVYATPLTPASQGTKASAPAPPRPQRTDEAPVRDDMSWINLGAR